ELPALGVRQVERGLVAAVAPPPQADALRVAEPAAGDPVGRVLEVVQFGLAEVAVTGRRRAAALAARGTVVADDDGDPLLHQELVPEPVAARPAVAHLCRVRTGVGVHEDGAPLARGEAARTQ